jgi:hypothetical protein
MAKRIFKNKHLVRNILILAVLLFIGFFVWRALFKNTKIFEGNIDRTDPGGSAIRTCDSIPNQNDLIGCLEGVLKIGNRGVIADFVDECEEKFPNNETEMEKCIVKVLSNRWYRLHGV